MLIYFILGFIVMTVTFYRAYDGNDQTEIKDIYIFSFGIIIWPFFAVANFLDFINHVAKRK